MSVHPGIVVIGTSLGGLTAMQTLLGGLGPEFPCPIALVQHRSNDAVDLLVPILQQYTKLRIREAEDKLPLEAGAVYIAPADYHFIVERGYCGLSLDPPVHFARPSVDVLFESAAYAYGNLSVGVVLTGSNADGVQGALCIKRAGGTIIVQDPAECEGPQMPESTLRGVDVDLILKISEMPSLLTELCRETGKV